MDGRENGRTEMRTDGQKNGHESDTELIDPDKYLQESEMITSRLLSHGKISGRERCFKNGPVNNF